MATTITLTEEQIEDHAGEVIRKLAAAIKHSSKYGLPKGFFVTSELPGRLSHKISVAVRADLNEMACCAEHLYLTASVMMAFRIIEYSLKKYLGRKTGVSAKKKSLLQTMKELEAILPEEDHELYHMIRSMRNHTVHTSRRYDAEKALEVIGGAVYIVLLAHFGE